MTRRFIILAGLDASAFLLALQLANMAPRCDGCLLAAFARFEPLQALLLTAVLLVTATAVGLYNNDAAEDFRIFLARFLLAWQLIFISSIVFVAVTKLAAGAPFGWYVGVLALAIALFMAILFTLHVLLVWCLGLAFMKKRVLVLGDSPGADAVTDFLNGAGSSHFRHVQTLRSWSPAESPRIGNVVLAVSPSAPPLLRLAEMLHADEIVVAVEDRRGLPVAELLECKLCGIEVVDALTFWEREAGMIDGSQVGPGCLAFSSGFVCHQRHRLLKRAIDLAISVPFLLAVLPMCLLVALAIRLESPGPVFYRQDRVGLNGRIFRLWKFRSMRTDAERDGVPQWAHAQDARVTRIGRFIRKVRIDEIPQLLNVLAGDMSFIGPRPERPFFVEQLRDLLPNYDLRHRVRPGITGWAQVNYPYGASIEDAKRKLSYDLYYLKKNDVLLDLAILVQTVRVVLFAHGAR